MLCGRPLQPRSVQGQIDLVGRRERRARRRNSRPAESGEIHARFVKDDIARVRRVRKSGAVQFGIVREYYGTAGSDRRRRIRIGGNCIQRHAARGARRARCSRRSGRSRDACTCGARRPCRTRGTCDSRRARCACGARRSRDACTCGARRPCRARGACDSRCARRSRDARTCRARRPCRAGTVWELFFVIRT